MFRHHISLPAAPSTPLVMNEDEMKKSVYQYDNGYFLNNFFIFKNLFLTLAH
jgi:hypothetical protein